VRLLLEVLPYRLRRSRLRRKQASPRRIGFLAAGSAATTRDWVEAFSRRLQELGWIEGRNVAIDIRYADGRAERFEEIAAEFVSSKVDVIVTWGTPTVLATKRATSVIPIVFAVAADPVGDGLVGSLARPGGNVGRRNGPPLGVCVLACPGLTAMQPTCDDLESPFVGCPDRTAPPAACVFGRTEARAMASHFRGYRNVSSCARAARIAAMCCARS
jgi:hypothetical protein